MRIISGTITDGVKHWSERVKRAPEAFKEATGEDIYPGTLNVKIGESITINEHFRVLGTKTGDHHEDYLLEICRIDSIWAYRVRPFGHADGTGGWGDDTLEILCKDNLREKLSKETGSAVSVEFFR